MYGFRNVLTTIAEIGMDKEQKKELRKAKRFTNEIDEKESRNVGSGYGICSGCKHMHFREFEYGHNIHALCGSYVEGFQSRLSKVHIITKCSEYEAKGVIEIETMWAIASLINIKSNMVISGFIDNEHHASGIEIKEPEFDEENMYEITEVD